MTQNDGSSSVTLVVGDRTIDITNELTTSIFSYGFVKPHAFPRYRELLDDIVALSKSYGTPLERLQDKTYEMSRDVAEQHYTVHRDRPFFKELIDMVTEGPSQHFVVHATEEGYDTVKALMKICGVTDSSKADENTIRRKYGEPSRGIPFNAIHRSDSLENFIVEVPLHFERRELGDFFWDRLEAYKKYLDSLRQP